MAKFHNGRRAKSGSGWNRRLKVARRERAAEQAEANEATRPRLRARGVVSESPDPGRGLGGRDA